MKEFDPLERSLREAFAPHEPRVELKQRALNLRRRSTNVRIWLAGGISGFAAAASLAVFFFFPAESLANKVIKQASRFEGHLTQYIELPNGQWKKIGDQWSQGSKVRISESGVNPIEILLDRDLGRRISWQEDQGILQIGTFKPGGSLGSPFPLVLTPGSLKDFAAKTGMRQTPTMEKSSFNGKPADCVSFSLGAFSSNHLYADPVTHQMLGWSFQLGKAFRHNFPEDAYTQVYVVDQKPFPKGIFEPSFRVHGVLTNVVDGMAKWRDRLAKPLFSHAATLTRRPYLKEQAPLSAIVSVRSVVVNKTGDVFVLFTGVDGPYGYNIYPSVIKDSSGGRYVKSMGFRPFEEGPHRLDQFSYDGKPLEGAWFVRLSGGPLGGPISIGFKQQFEPETKLAFTYESEPERIDSSIPSYMPYMALPIGTEHEVIELHAFEQAQDRNRAGDIKGEEHWIREQISLRESIGRASFTRAEDLYYRLGKVLEREGRKKEALTSYQRAKRELEASGRDWEEWDKKQIYAGLSRLSHKN